MMEQNRDTIDVIVDSCIVTPNLIDIQTDTGCVIEKAYKIQVSLERFYGNSVTNMLKWIYDNKGEAFIYETVDRFYQQDNSMLRMFE